MMMSGKKSAARSSSRSAHGMHINGKTLVPSWRNVIKFVVRRRPCASVRAIAS